MPAPERVVAVVGEWVTKAENDLKNAAHTLKLEEDCPTDTVCFHAQQCAEKYLKAFLVSVGVDFPRNHDIETLVALLPTGIEVGLAASEQRRLTTYATVSRYPGDYEPISLAEARQAVRIARRVRRALRRHLPKESLKKKQG